MTDMGMTLLGIGIGLACPLAMVLVLIAGRALLRATASLAHGGIVRLTPESRHGQRAAVAAVTYACPRSWVFAVGNIAMTISVGPQDNDEVRDVARKLERLAVARLDARWMKGDDE